MNMKVSIETVIEALEDAIRAHDKPKTLILISELREAVRNDMAAVKWITEPANIAHLHSLLTEELGVPPKAMQLRNRISHRQRRAWMFVEALENGLRRVI